MCPTQTKAKWSKRKKRRIFFCGLVLRSQDTLNVRMLLRLPNEAPALLWLGEGPCLERAEAVPLSPLTSPALSPSSGPSVPRASGGACGERHPPQLIRQKLGQEWLDDEAREEDRLID